MKDRILCIALALILPSLAIGNELPASFGPKPPAPSTLQLESRVDSLEIAMRALESRLVQVERVANEDYLRKLIKEIITTEYAVRTSSGQVQNRSVSYAGYGTIQLAPGEELVSVGNVPVGRPQSTSHFMGQPSAYYSTPSYQYRVQTMPVSQTRRVWLRPRQRVMSGGGVICEGGVCRPAY